MGLDSVAEQFHVDRWANQKFRPELWIEKEALVGVIEDVCDELDVPYFACRGYVSQSEQWRAGRRFGACRQTPVVLHLGDHDPSGIDMTRDNDDRLATFAGQPVVVRRLALNMDQIEEHQPPPNPAKDTDTRFNTYYDQFGDECWELDALEPQVMVDLIRDAIEGYIDPDAWRESGEREREGRARLAEVSERWEEIVELLADEESR